MSENLNWWKEGVFYQIYPRSFYDSNDDGIGDLPGITQKLDYLKWLGIEGLWLSPFFESPMDDFGYDITDYLNVDPIFGTLNDFDTMMAKSNELGLKIILDLVPNHTSYKHPWFQESRSSRDNPKADWYIWRDAKPDGSPPNNWCAISSIKKIGSAWAWDETRKQYFLASFSPVQPDVNWRNPEVKAAIMDVLRFWLDRGVYGFRIDMIDYLSKDAEFRDEPSSTFEAKDYISTAVYHLNQVETLQYVKEMRQVMDQYPARVTIGETAYHHPLEQLLKFTEHGLDIPFNFRFTIAPLTKAFLEGFVKTYDMTFGTKAQPNYSFANHDVLRATRLGDPGARLAAMLLLTLRGTPFVYYGEELGMENVDVPPERRQDPFVSYESGGTRDPNRTPMQWTPGPFAGFTSVEPWLPLGPNYATINVEVEKQNPNSMLMLYKRLIEFRQSHPAMRQGHMMVLDFMGDVYGYTRTANDDQVLILLNLGDSEETVNLPAGEWSLQISTLHTQSDTVVLSPLRLQAHEGTVLLKKN